MFKNWQLHDQEHLSAELPGGVDIESHMSLFQALLQKVDNIRVKVQGDIVFVHKADCEYLSPFPGLSGAWEQGYEYLST